MVVESESMSFNNKISEIGSKLVTCRNHALGYCLGIENIPDNNIIPRCLYLEPRDTEFVDCAIVGINPGNTSQRENNWYKDKGVSYDNIVVYFLYFLMKSIDSLIDFQVDSIWGCQ